MLIDFWTYTCINCIRTLPYLEAWDAKYRRKGLVIVGVESPEFPFERDAGNVAQRDRGSSASTIPSSRTTTSTRGTAWGNEYWPADYLIDATGQVRYSTFGEGDYTTTEAAIRALLARGRGQGPRRRRAGARRDRALVRRPRPRPTSAPRAPRAGSAASRSPARTPTASPATPLSLNDFSYGGTWTIGAQQALAGAGATIDAEVKAKNVYIVLSPPANGRRPRRGLGRRPPDEDDRGDRAAPLPGRGVRERLASTRSTWRFSPATSGYSFTFG